MDDLKGTHRNYHRVGESIVVDLLDFIRKFDGIFSGELACWLWRVGLGRTWLAVQEFLPLHEPDQEVVPPPNPDFTSWNRRWEIHEFSLVWLVRCRKIWIGFTHPCSRFIIWRLLSYAYYSNSWGALWGVNPTCPICLVSPETPNHLFFECWCTRNRWARIQVATKGTRFDFSNCFTLLEMTSTTIARQRCCPALFLIFVETIHLIWTKCNSVGFRQDRSEAPNTLIWRRVGDRLDALLYKLENIQIFQTVNEDRRRISYFKPSVTVTISDPLH